MMTAPRPGHLIERLPRTRGRLLADAALGPMTWFRVGGPAEVLFRPADTADLTDFLAAKPADVPVTVLGVGSNLLVRDGGVEGVVIRLDRHAAEAARRQPQDHARQSAVADDEVGGGAQHRHRRRRIEGGEQARKILDIGRAREPLRRPAHAEPGEGREARARLHPAADGRHAMGCGVAHAHARRSGVTRAPPWAWSPASCSGSAWAQAVMLPAPRQTT